MNVASLAPGNRSRQEPRSDSFSAREFPDEEVSNIGVVFGLRPGIGNLLDQLKPQTTNQHLAAFRHPALPETSCTQMRFHPFRAALEKLILRLRYRAAHTRAQSITQFR